MEACDAATFADMKAATSGNPLVAQELQLRDKLKKLQAVVIVLDLSHGNLGSMQYHPSAGWLKNNGYSTDLEKCVHIPRAADLATKRNINEQPWVILHELAHAYHDQVLGFDEPRIREVSYADLEHVNVMRDFLNHPELFILHRSLRNGPAKLVLLVDSWCDRGE